MLLLGLDTGAYETLLRLLGLVILLMLLVLIAQNRHEVADAIGAEPARDSDEPAPVSSIRRGFARVWHLLTGGYLVLIYGIWALQIQDGAGYLLRASLLSLAALAAARVLAHAIDQLFERGLRLSDEMREQQRDNIRRALEACDWKISGPGSAADLLGIKPSTLRSQIKAMSIEIPAN